VPGEVAQAIAKFPQMLFHSVEEKLCPLLAFFQTLGVSEKQLAKLLMVNLRLISYSKRLSSPRRSTSLSASALTRKA
jgi:mTERF domain-containing protein, mitochondrial